MWQGCCSRQARTKNEKATGEDKKDGKKSDEDKKDTEEDYWKHYAEQTVLSTIALILNPMVRDLLIAEVKEKRFWITSIDQA